jgi:multisubunit Na+/H+ antiporter MnhB subunit
VDVALTEAAIGGGVTGVLLIGAAARLRGAGNAEAAEQPNEPQRFWAAALCVLVTAALAAVVLLLPDPAPTLAPEAAQNLAETGLGNPITAVLIAYRSFDTMLEKVVLVLAVVGVWSLAPDRYWGGAPGTPRAARPERTLAFLAQLLPPLGILIGIHIFWAGADGAGRRLSGRCHSRRHVDDHHDGEARRSAPDQCPLAAARACRGPGRVSGDRRRWHRRGERVIRLSRRVR